MRALFRAKFTVPTVSELVRKARELVSAGEAPRKSNALSEGSTFQLDEATMFDAAAAAKFNEDDFAPMEVVPCVDLRMPTKSSHATLRRKTIASLASFF